MDSSAQIIIKSDFILRKVASSWMAIPVGKRTGEMTGLIALNDSAAFLWEFFQTKHTREEAVDALLGEYEIDRETAALAVDKLLLELEQNGLLET